jgi:ATP-binding cassette, subfamily F, member 3
VDSPFDFEFRQPDKLPRPLLALENQSAGYGERVLLQQVDLTIAPGARIALLGRNGAGKSTLMKLLAGELAGLAGTRTEARDLVLGYFAQHQLEQLASDDSPLGNLKRLGGALATRATEQELRDFLAGFGFAGERVFAPVAPFSGGEKARLMLAVVTFRRPNLLLLDEPTNHLDLEMRQALAVALQDYAGAVILVSHDRHLLRTVADEFYVVDAGRVQPFDGDLEDYAQWVTAQASASRAVDTIGAAAETQSADSAEARRQRRREDAQRRAALSPLKAQLAELEKQLDTLARATQQVQAALTAPELYSEGAKTRLRALLDQQIQLARDTERVESQWLAGGEQLEALQQSLLAAPD